MYFQKFPLRFYDILNNKKPILLTDISRRVKIQEFVKNLGSVFLEYTIKDSDTAESIAYKFYGSAERDWIIFIANDIVNPFFDWPLTSFEMERYLEDKYDTDIDATHHYEDSFGEWVNSDAVGAVSVSNRQYEESLNESKRNIRLIDSKFVAQIERELEVLINE